jgi:dienelactone hydrolase
MGRFARGVELALRSGAAPLIVGARLASRWLEGAPLDLPAPRGGLAVASKIALDEFFFATELAVAPVVRPGEQRRVMRELAQALELFEARGWLADPSEYHLEPPPLEDAQTREARLPGHPYEWLSFESGYEPHAEEPGRERWLGYEPNRTAHAWVFRHAGAPRPWVVCVPGYRMGHPLVDFAGFRARWLHRSLGLNVAIPVLPFHGPRRTGRRSGNGYFSLDFVDTVHAQSQALWDVRRLLSWIRAQGAPAVGLYGVSLGAYTTALVAAIEEDLDCVVAGIPAADFARLVRSHVPPLLLRAAERIGFSFARVERLLHVVSPFAFAPRTPGERCFVFAGLADRLVSPAQARDLWEHWGRPRVTWYHGSHCSFLWEPEVKALLLEAFEERGLIGARA